MIFRQLIDFETNTFTYLIADKTTSEALLIDTVNTHLSHYLAILNELKLSLKYTLETHIHADHITCASLLKKQLGSEIIIPENAKAENADRVIGDNETLHIGKIILTAIATPGHTDSHMAYLVGDQLLFTGDALLIRGCGRTDFQGGDAATLYQSISQRLFSLPNDVIVYPGHDYNGNTSSTIGEEKAFNPRLANKTKQEFIAIMNQLNLPYPKYIDKAMPANLQCGKE